MKVRNVIALAPFGLMIMIGSADRAEARHGWGWGGVGAGIAAAIILSEVYRHHHHHRYYYGGYPYYDYDDYPYYGGTTVVPAGTTIAMASTIGTMGTTAITAIITITATSCRRYFWPSAEHIRRSFWLAVAIAFLHAFALDLRLGAVRRPMIDEHEASTVLSRQVGLLLRWLPQSTLARLRSEHAANVKPR